MYQQKQRTSGRVVWLAAGLAVLLGLCLWTASSERNISGLNPNARERLEEFAKSHSLSLADYPQSILELYERNPETEEFVLHYPLRYGNRQPVDMTEYADCRQVPLFMQWDSRWGYMDYGDDVAGITGCGPVCLSMVAWYVTGDTSMSPDRIIQFAQDNGYYVSGSGSAWSLISQGGQKLGLDVTEIPLDKEQIFSNLEANDPIICVMGPGDFTTTGHFVVIAGCQDGKLRINDPNSKVNSQKLWDYDEICDQILNLWAIHA